MILDIVLPTLKQISTLKQKSRLAVYPERLVSLVAIDFGFRELNKNRKKSLHSKKKTNKLRNPSNLFRLFNMTSLLFQ